jgi:hypothetical protein
MLTCGELHLDGNLKLLLVDRHALQGEISIPTQCLFWLGEKP